MPSSSRRRSGSGGPAAAGSKPQNQTVDMAGTLASKVKALEAETALYRHALESLRNEMQAFAYSVSHDLRAPVRAIQGFSKILVEDFSTQLDDEAKNFLQHIVQSTEHLSSQIEDLLLFYRLGKNSPKKTLIQPVEIVKELLSEQKVLNPQSRVTAEVGELPETIGDPDLMRQVFSQLISNAVKFSREATQPRVTVKGKSENGAAIYIVEDNGVGFDMAYRDKLFQVFQKLHGDFPGNGIGLAIVKKIVAAHGGCVWAEGSPEGGARFFVSLPQSTAEQKPASLVSA